MQFDIFGTLLNQVKAAVDKALQDTAVEIQAEARQEAPYDTGALKDSIIAERVGEMEYKVTANTNYAQAVHEGFTTRTGKYIRGRPYLIRPFNAKIVKIADKIRDNL